MKAIGKIRFLFAKMLPVCIKLLWASLLIFLGYGSGDQNIWLISERGTDARDNGFAFFRYLREVHPEIACRYVIENSSADYSKVVQVGDAVQYGSLAHYVLMLRAECLISSHIMGFSPEPEVFQILQAKRLFRLPGKQIFLQHGIIKDDIEGLKYPNVVVDLFICGALAEYQYIRGHYRHPESVVRFTGLARYDILENWDGKRQILLMPTWRKWLNSVSDGVFLESDYYRAYSELLSNADLQCWLEKHGFDLVFYPHYEMQKFVHLFEKYKNENIHIAKFANADVQTLLKESQLLITDYSSVYFDFAYLKKPIVFYQFDKERFFTEHYNRGYFEETQFGEVVTTSGKLAAGIKDMFDGKAFVNAYLNQQADFFTGVSGGCCDRIYRAIRGLLDE